MNQRSGRFWQYPWCYKESVAVVSGIIVVGFILQITTMAFDFSLLKYPVNLILGFLVLLFLFIFSFWRNRDFYKWFSGISFSVTLITALLLLALIMGLTPQTDSHLPSNASLHSILGFDRMVSSWPLVLIYFLTILSLGALIVRRIIAFQIKDYTFYLIHIGLWLILFASGLGAADRERYLMRVYEGEVEWRGLTDKNEIKELPVAIELNDFYMEVYPPSLAIIDRNTGIIQPENKPEFFAIDAQRPEGKLAGWTILFEKYIHQAVRNSDSSYHEVHMPGSSPAAKITAINSITAAEYSGWVCSGNVAQLYMTLNLDTNYCIAMMRPEPKRFVSDIHVYRKDKEVEHALLEVNKPYRAGAWIIYQHSYDEVAGNLSNYSEMELVYDPWLPFVYTGIFLLAAGALCLIWAGNKRKEARI
ncbi:MAG: cytochrome c biogenesis protein ResB [Prevotellaceae bacterium]|jgi:hypothetical protein|nr:cytochrome c biogenesis protein ResB [Prevotellaceae bacterium]